MADNTTIEWARHPVTGRGASWNPLLARTHATGKVGYHCEHVSPGCEHCYSEAFNQRRLPARGTGLPFKPGHRKDVDIFLDEAQLLLPLKWKAPRGIFVCSMTDLFGDFVPDELIDRMFAVMALAPQHVFMVLTKRDNRMRRYLTDPTTPRRIHELACELVLKHGVRVVLMAPGMDPTDAPPGPRVQLGQWPLPNVWLGVSVEDQQRADERIPHLLATPSAVRFVSAEPLLGPIDIEWAMSRNFLDIGAGFLQRGIFSPNLRKLRPLDWVIVGGESGSGARPMHPDWARSLRDQCAAAGVPFFFKQWGSWAFAPEGMNFDEARRWATANRYSLSRRTEAWGGSGGFPSRYEQFSNGRTAFHTGKKDAGRLLDGVEHNAMPGIASC